MRADANPTHHAPLMHVNDCCFNRPTMNETTITQDHRPARCLQLHSDDNVELAVDVASGALMKPERLGRA
jgi:hypothetical protein